jgi:hypothetical protein
MALEARWKLLPVDQDDVPQLLVKAHFDSTGYRIQITDLCRIWEESLTHDECVQRAVDSGSSIDPSQDEEQFRILLTKIQSAFDFEDGTTLQLSASKSSKDDFCIPLTAALPKPLAPLEWTVNLHRLQAQHLERELVAPLLSEASRLQLQMEQLVAELQNKDRVISKICDRLECSGNDLTTVFPGVSNIKISRKKGQREQLAKHVKGLADFDESTWKQQSDAVLKDNDLHTGQLNSVLRGLPGTAALADTFEADDGWWQRLESPNQQPAHRKRASSRQPETLQNQTSYSHEQSFQDDGFQRQATPPRLRVYDTPIDNAVDAAGETSQIQQGRSRLGEPEAGDESTTEGEDEDDLDAPPKEHTASQNYGTKQRQGADGTKQVPTVPKKLGRIGGRQEQQPPTSSASRAGTNAGTPRQSSAAPGASEDTTSQRSPPKPKAAKKFGAIGGKAVSAGDNLDDGASREKTTSPQPSKSRKMGMIGGKKRKEGTPEAAPPDTAPTSHANDAGTPEPARRQAVPEKSSLAQHETAQEQADKKRDTLKRELEQKAKAPVKKKRKF